MHKTKRMARNLAWSDNKNPFAKRRAQRTVDLQNEAENGNGSPLFRHITDDPGDYGQRNMDPEASDFRSRQSATVPAAMSRRTEHDAGDHIGEIPQSASPPASIRGMQAHADSSSGDKTIVDANEKSFAEEPTENGGKTHHGLKGWLHKSSAEKEQAQADDNNGKDKKQKKNHNFTFMSQIRATLLNSWINVLLIACPVGIALNYAHVNPVAIFVVNFIAIIPLAAMLSYATEEIALRTGEVIGGLLNASFGNAVELIVSIIALAKGQILIVQTSLIGSMLSNLLLVMGMCFFAGGINRVEQAFNMTVAQTASSLLFLAVSALIIPTAFLTWAQDVKTDDGSSSAGKLQRGEASLSRGTAILLLLVYAAYLFFQLKSHSKMYQLPSEKNEKRDFTKHKNKVKSMIPGKIRRRSLETSSNHNSEANSDDEDEPEEPQLHIWVAVLTLAISTVFVALNAEYLVDSINAITCGSDGISKNFVGLILLPIVGNAAEHATAVTVAIKDKMDLAIGVAVGSSMQIALLVLPLVVVLGWILGKDNMTLYFDGFQIVVLFVSVLLVNYLIQDGKSHWLEGILLMILYIIIALAAWFYPTAAAEADCPA